MRTLSIKHYNKTYLKILSVLLLLLAAATPPAYPAFAKNNFVQTDSISADWIKAHLQKKGPKIVLTSHQLKALKKAVKKDPVVQAYYTYLYKNAVSILTLPFLERQLEGRRLLSVSREAVSRIGTLSIVYAVSNERRFLDRLDKEITTVCHFSDWNPSHFLDVGEMAYGVAIGLDWSLGKLPASTIVLAKKALIEKALKPSLNRKYSNWIRNTTNWNQVCHGGISIAAIAIADQYPTLAATIIDRAVKNIPIALKQYGPDGVYPEGASYWAYGTSYTLLTLSALRSAFNTDFNLSQTLGFMESALFVEMVTAPSGLYYNYFDSRTHNEWALERYELMAWFAMATENRKYFNETELIYSASKATTDGVHISRLSGAALCWILNIKDIQAQPFPENWKGDGKNPVVVFKSQGTPSSNFYLAAKGGRASLSHGNMDAGSFIFELYGIRWSVDLGLQDYTKLEKTIGTKGLWDSAQDGIRWTLLSKNNFGHSTLTVNDQLHKANGQVPLIGFVDSKTQPEATFDLSALFSGGLTSAVRKFKKLDEEKLEIEDSLVLTADTKTITWTMITQAYAEITDKGFVLTQNGKSITVNLVSPLRAEMKITSLDPPPLEYDMQVPNLKKVTFTIDATTLKNNNLKIKVEIAGKKMVFPQDK